MSRSDFPKTPAIREKRRERCRNCGQSGVELHHAIPRSLAQISWRDDRNALPLCWGCHRGFHDRTLTIYRDVFTAREWAYLTGIDLIGIQGWLDQRYPPQPATVFDV